MAGGDHGRARGGEIDGILHYSPRSAQLALALMGAARAGLLHFCLSQAVADVCGAQVAAEKLLISSHPTEEWLMTLLGRRDASDGGATT